MDAFGQRCDDVGGEAAERVAGERGRFVHRYVGEFARHLADRLPQGAEHVRPGGGPAQRPQRVAGRDRPQAGRVEIVRQRDRVEPGERAGNGVGRESLAQGHIERPGIATNISARAGGQQVRLGEGELVSAPLVRVEQVGGELAVPRAQPGHSGDDSIELGIERIEQLQARGELKDGVHGRLVPRWRLRSSSSGVSWKPTVIW